MEHLSNPQPDPRDQPASMAPDSEPASPQPLRPWSTPRLLRLNGADAGKPRLGLETSGAIPVYGPS